MWAPPSSSDARVTAVRACLAVYVVCFSVGVTTHGLDFLERGPRPYASAPLPLELFWSALIFVDALAVILLLTGRRRAGLALALAIMVADVGVNSIVGYVPGDGTMGWALQLQSLFLGFVLGSVGFLWPRSDEPLKASIAAQP